MFVRFGRRFGPGLACGLLTAASVPPFGFWIAGILGLAAHAFHVFRLGAKGRAVAGFGFGVGLYAVGIFWTHEFSWPGLIALILIETTYVTLSSAATPTRSSIGRPVAFAAALALGEWGRTVFPFEGFPMGGITLGQAAGPLVPAARTAGAGFGVTLAVGLVAGLLAELAVFALAGRAPTAPAPAPAPKRQVLAGTLALPLVLAVALVVAGGGPGKAVGQLDVAMVQGGGPRGTRAITSNARDVLDRHLAAAEQLVKAPGPKPDVVLLPENTAVTDDYLGGTEEGDLLRDLAQRLGGPTLLVGVVEEQPFDTTRFQNLQVAIDPDGRITGQYAKVHRVPFGEYAPYRDLIAKVADLTLLPRDAIAGTEPGLLTDVKGRPLGVLISYELFFGDRARASIGAGAQVLMGPTNAASYTTSQVPDQEIGASRLRAWETGRDVAMVAPTGFSAFVLADGTVLQKSSLGTAEVLRHTLVMRTGETLYVQTGERPWGVLSLFIVVGVWLEGERRRRFPKAVTPDAP